MATAAVKKRRYLAATAALVCALVASMVIGVGAAAAEGDSAPLRPVSEGGLSFGEIRSPSDPEEYPLQFELGETPSCARSTNTK